MMMMITPPLPLLLFTVLVAVVCGPCHAFSPLRSPFHSARTAAISRDLPPLFAAADSDDGSSPVEESPKALSPATSNDASSIDSTIPSSSSSTVFMMTRDMQRILIEELGYSRRDVNVMRVELAAPIIEKRIPCPTEGIPQEWMDVSRTEQDAMLKRLEQESKYPLKVPLLFVSGILAGKGSSDAIITLIKVKMSFPGASLAKEFMGVNVLAIDAVCMAAGVALGVWTWKTMRDEL